MRPHNDTKNSLGQRRYVDRWSTLTRIITIIILFNLSSSARAAMAGMDEDDLRPVTSFFIQPEYFKWEEFDSDTGKSILKEFGPRIRSGFSTQGTAIHIPNRLLDVDFEANAYMGVVDYDGSTSMGTALTTSTQYAGFSASVLTGIRLFRSDSDALVLTIRGDGDNWSRIIRSAVDAQGTYAGGYEEIYWIGTARVGAKYISTRIPRLSFEAGVRRPFFTKEQVQTFGIILRPKPALGYYVQYDLVSNAKSLSKFRVSITYDLINMEQSPDVVSSVNGFTYAQPRFSSQVIGLRISF